jgi:hypothetical protein
MKTTIVILAIFFSSTILLAKAQPNLLAGQPAEMVMAEEAYVNDIPFDTWMISKAACPESLMVRLPEEGYVDDIPFDTELIASKALLNTVMEEENPVNDIPFSTEEVYNEIMLEEFIAQWQAEQSVDDLPLVPMITWRYDARADMLIYQSGATLHIKGFRGLNSLDFMIDTEKYLEGLDEKIRDLEQVSITYPF